MAGTADAAELVRFMAQALVADVEAVAVVEVDGGRTLELETSPDDRGRVIGRQGRVAKAMRAVLPRDVPILPVGSISVDNMAGYWNAGANGFGLGSALYRAGAGAEQVAASAQQFVTAIRRLMQPT